MSESGTIEEIERHLNSNKPAMLYFSDTPVSINSVDQEQYNRLLKFKEDCYAKGYVETYESIEEFREKLKDHLALTIQNNNYFQIAEGLSFETSQIEAYEDIDENESLKRTLSKEAKEMLIGCAKKEKSILLIKFIGDNFSLQAHDNFEGRGQREYAKWKSVFEELEFADLITENYFEGGESYDLTNKGYEFADYLGK